MTKATRMTKQKRVILDVLKSTKSHPPADWIYIQARKVLPNLSLGTVYRNLNILRDMGEILELNYGSTLSRYDGNPQEHYHFVCEKCGAVLDVDIPVQKELEILAAQELEAEIEHHRLEFYGVCRKCKRPEPQN